MMLGLRSALEWGRISPPCLGILTLPLPNRSAAWGAVVTLLAPRQYELRAHPSVFKVDPPALAVEPKLQSLAKPSQLPSCHAGEVRYQALCQLFGLGQLVRGIGWRRPVDTHNV